MVVALLETGLPQGWGIAEDTVAVFRGNDLEVLAPPRMSW